MPLFSCTLIGLACGVFFSQCCFACFAVVLRGVLDPTDQPLELHGSDLPEPWLNASELAFNSQDAGANPLVRFYRSLNGSDVVRDADADQKAWTSHLSSAAAEDDSDSSESILDAAHLADSTHASASGSTVFSGSVSNDGSLPLISTRQGWYAIDVGIGGAPVRLAVDTGSSYLWHRPRTANASGSQSSSNDTPMQHFTAQYGRGAVSGDIYDETVAFGEHTLSCAVGSAADLSAFWARQSSIDGVIGLACSSLAPAGALDCAWQWDRKVFALSLDRDGGKLFLGSVPAQYESSLVYFPADDDCTHWRVPLLSLTVAKAGQRPQDALSGAHLAVLDSGSDGIVGPAQEMQELAARVGGTPERAGNAYDASVTFFTVPCEQTLPDVEITLGTADGSDAGQASVRIAGEHLMANEAMKSGQARCRLRLVGWEKTEEWILGRIFLTQVQAAVFEMDRRRIGLAL